MRILLPEGQETAAPAEAVIRFAPGYAGAPPLEAIPEGGEYLWVVAPGATPIAHAIPAVRQWLEARSPDALVGDTEGPRGFTRRPRATGYALWAMPSVGESIVVRADFLRTVLGALIDPDLWYFQLTIAASADRLEHIPVPISRLEQVPPASPAEARARIVTAITGVECQVRNGAVAPVASTEGMSVSLVIPSIGAKLDTGEPAIIRCVRNLHAEPAEVVVVAGSAMPAEVLDELAELLGDHLQVVRVPDPFNFSHSCNAGVLKASSSHVLLLNDDVEATGPEWLEAMCRRAALPGVGAVGARLLFPTGKIQHAGIVINPRSLEPNHLYMGHRPADIADPVAHGTASFLAVTGACLLVERDLYLHAGGLTEELPLNYNDVDFCLKLVAQGYTNLQCNDVSLIHRESTSRVPVLADFEARWMERWEPWIGLDPYVNVWL